MADALSAPFPKQPLVADDDALVIRLAGRQAADPSADPRGLAQVAQVLRQEKSDAALYQLIEARRTAAKLWINPELAPITKAAVD